jgi:hypothetical protein
MFRLFRRTNVSSVFHEENQFEYNFGEVSSFSKLFFLNESLRPNLGKVPLRAFCPFSPLFQDMMRSFEGLGPYFLRKNDIFSVFAIPIKLPPPPGLSSAGV